MSDGSDIKRVAVIGAGAMGASIAALFANAGIPVDLFDVVPSGAKDRNELANKAIERMKKASLAPKEDPLNGAFYHPDNAKFITARNTEDHLDRLKEADWIVEVIPENIAWKKALYEKIEKVIGRDTIISSNTSTLPLAQLLEGRSDAFRSNFMITHFFNPPRFQRLLETVTGTETKPEIAAKVSDFCDKQLGKTVVPCKDTVGFKGNRIGSYALLKAVVESVKQGLRIDEVDAILGKPVGFQGSGVFGTMDVVGLDTAFNVMNSLEKNLPASDEFHTLFAEAKDLGVIGRMQELVDSGRVGRKAIDKTTKQAIGGFIRAKRDDDGKEMRGADGKKILEALDLATGEYHEQRKIKAASTQAGFKGLKAVFETDDKLGKFAWTVLRDTMAYTASLVPEISNEAHTVDEALRTGYGWKRGTFEMIDAVSNDWFVKKLEQEKISVPPMLQAAGKAAIYSIAENGKRQSMGWNGNAFAPVEIPQKEGILSLADAKRGKKPVVSGGSASTWDIGDGILCFELHSKMNAVDGSTLHVLNETLKTIGDGKGEYKGLVLYSDNPDVFSAGANLGLALTFAVTQQHHVVDLMVHSGQAIARAVREAPFPTVAVVRGMEFGGGEELADACTKRYYAPETYAGQVEIGPGFIPSWGGCKNLLERTAAQNPKARNPQELSRAAFEKLAIPPVSTSALDAKKQLWASKDDVIVPNSERVLFEAKQEVLRMLDAGYTPKAPRLFNLPGNTVKAFLDAAVDGFVSKGMASSHDVPVCEALATVLTGGDTHAGKLLTETEMDVLERENFMSLVPTKGTQKRLIHMLKEGKPLREPPPAMDEIDDLRAGRPPYPINKTLVTDGKPITGKAAVMLEELAIASEAFNYVANKFPKSVQKPIMGAIAYATGFAMNVTNECYNNPRRKKLEV